MCKSRAQGGQRCFPAVERRLATAEAAYRAAVTGPSAAAVARTVRAREAALIDYATTPAGADTIAARATAARAAGDDGAAGEWARILTRGVARRDHAERRYQQWRTEQGLPVTQPRTTRPRQDRCPECGEWASAHHQCPEPAGHPTDPNKAGTSSVGMSLFESIPLTDGELADIRDQYGDTDPNLLAAELAEHTVDPHSINPLSAGAVADPWAIAAKREAADQVTAQLAHLSAAHLLDPDARARLDTGPVHVTSTGRLVVPAADSRSGYRFVADNQPAPTRSGAPTLLEQVDDQAVRRDAAVEVMDRWAGTFTADPTSPGAALQAAAAIEFTDPARPARTWAERRDRAVLRAQYAATQAWLADRGISEVTVHRGMGWGDDVDVAGQASRATPDWYEPDHDGTHPVTPALNPLSSTSTRRLVAEAFSLGANDADDRAVITTTVPAERIVSTPRTGMGCLAEHELVIADGPGQWHLTSDYL